MLPIQLGEHFSSLALPKQQNLLYNTNKKSFSLHKKNQINQSVVIPAVVINSVGKPHQMTIRNFIFMMHYLPGIIIICCFFFSYLVSENWLLR